MLVQISYYFILTKNSTKNINTLIDNIFYIDSISSVELNEEDREYIKNFIEYITQNIDKIEIYLSEKTAKKDISKSSFLSRAILLVGYYEIKISNTAKAIVINENIEIAKQYGDENDSKLVNAVLDKIEV